MFFAGLGKSIAPEGAPTKARPFTADPLLDDIVGARLRAMLFAGLGKSIAPEGAPTGAVGARLFVGEAFMPDAFDQPFGC
jgi:hypothetical protein